MKKLLVGIFLMILIVSCVAEDNKILDQAQPALSLYIDLITNHYIDRPWRKANLGKIFHPDQNFLEGKTYQGITEELPRYEGNNLFTALKIVTVYTRKEWVNLSKPKTFEEDVIYVKITYKVVGITRNDKISLLASPLSVSQYLIMAIDQGDNMYKIIDSYPSSYDIYISAKYYLDHIDLFEGVNTSALKNQLIELLKKQQ